MGPVTTAFCKCDGQPRTLLSPCVQAKLKGSLQSLYVMKVDVSGWLWVFGATGTAVLWPLAKFLLIFGRSRSNSAACAVKITNAHL